MNSKTVQQLNLIHFSLQTGPSSTHNQFACLFVGVVGCIKNGKVALHIDKSVAPFAQIHCRLPFHVLKDVENEEKQSLDIIEKVEGPTLGVNPIVAVPKTGRMRLCIDMRGANRAIKRIEHPIQTIDDMIEDLNVTIVFSKLDM